MGTKRSLRKWGTRLLPMSVLRQLVNFKILAVSYGQYRTLRRLACLDNKNVEIPWYTYPAIEYLNNIDFSGKTVFEYGSGNSSKYWSRKAKSVFSVEHDKAWYEKIKGGLSANQTIKLCESEQEYLGAISNTTGKFDIIIIDGEFREKCALIVGEHLAEDGIIILDNSDWFKKTAAYLRDMDLLEVDFHGFGPINSYTWTTSIFFSRNARPRPVDNIQPAYSLAAIRDEYEKFD